MKKRFLVTYLINGLRLTSQVWARNALDAKSQLRKDKSPFGYSTIGILDVKEFSKSSK